MILFLSQDQSFLTKMTHRLRGMGKVALGISRYEDLWIRVRQNPPDIIIFDDNRAQVDPIEIMRRLQVEGFKGKAVMLVGESPEMLVPEVSKLGAIQIAGRPFSVNRVICAIRIAQEQLQADRYTTSLA